MFEALHAEATRRNKSFNDLVGEHLAELVDVPYTQENPHVDTRT